MELPFSIQQFFQVFKEYNLDVWPAQVFLYLMALVSTFAVFRSRPSSARLILLVLAVLWLWMGIVYHLFYFSPVNSAALLFAIAFCVQGVIFLYLCLTNPMIQFEFHTDLAGITGIALIAYALLGYPVLGHLIGHKYPAAPTFGVPCPTTIFTFGLFLFSTNRVHWAVFTIPLIWSLVGFTASVQLGVIEDFGLVIAGPLTVIISLVVKPGSSMILFPSRNPDD